MARSGSEFLPLLPRRNARSDSFSKRNTERASYERIRTYEPCVVVSARINKVYMYAVSSDERVYSAEYPPRALTAAVSFGRVRDIESVNDSPGFLSPKDRERCQHIRITYVPEEPAGKERDWLSREKKEGLPPVAPPSRRASSCPIKAIDLKAHPADSRWKKEELHPSLKTSRSASCPDPQTSGLSTIPHPPFQPPSSYSPSSPSSPLEETVKSPESGQVTRRIGSISTRSSRRDRANVAEEQEAELHLYAVSQTSTLYLHSQSSWNSFIIKSTLLLDPVYRRRCKASSDSISGERTAHLFAQSSSEVSQDGITMENSYLSSQESKTAAHRNITSRRLFWRAGEVFSFSVQTSEECLHGVYTTDQLSSSTSIVQTLAIMLRETEVEAARSSSSFAKKGASISRSSLALICDPDGEKNSRGCASDSGLQALLSEYSDAACSSLFELSSLGFESSRRIPGDNFVSVTWILRVLQPHPHSPSFIRHQARQSVQVSSDRSISSPVESVSSFQRCRLSSACSQYNKQSCQHSQSHFSEEFRYFVTPTSAEEKLQPHYPICRPTVRLVRCISSLIQLG